MATFDVTVKHRNNTAEITAVGSGAILIIPQHETWPGCNTQTEAEGCGAVYAMAIVDALLNAYNRPLDYDVTPWNGGLMVTVELYVANQIVNASLTFPNESSVGNAKFRAKEAFFKAAIETSTTCEFKFFNHITRSLYPTWPGWALEVRRRWIVD